MAYNMKGSPMLRNFGIGASPAKTHKPGHKALPKKKQPEGPPKPPKPTPRDLRDQRRQEAAEPRKTPGTPPMTSPVKQTEGVVSKTSPGEGWTKTKGTNIWAPPKKEKMMMKESKQLKKSSDLTSDSLPTRKQKTTDADPLHNTYKTKKMHATLTKKLKPKTKTLPEKLQEKKDKQKIFRK